MTIPLRFPDDLTEEERCLAAAIYLSAVDIPACVADDRRSRLRETVTALATMSPTWAREFCFEILGVAAICSR